MKSESMTQQPGKAVERAQGVSRRTFLTGSAVLGTAAFLTPTSKVLGANERLRVGVCGVNGRGHGHMRSLEDMDGVEIAWIVDPDRRLLEGRAQEVKERTGKRPRTTTDVRRALEDWKLDAISVATPNHWHSLMVIWAAQAGKHCYVEKPASHDIYEGRVALEAANKYGVVVQHGTQRRSSMSWARRIQAIHSGKYGRLAISHAFACKPRNGIGRYPASNPPDWLDWDLWRGHAVIPEFNENFVHYNWHWYWPTGNGDLNNQGTHQLDIAYWALDPEMRYEHPVRVTCLGGRFQWDDGGETPNHQFAVAEYPNGQKVLMNVRNVNYDDYERQVENRFYFEDGGKIIGNRYISPDGDEEEVEPDEEPDITQGGPFGSFVKACRAGDPKMVNAGMHEGHYSSALGHMMNTSYRMGEKKPFNQKAGRFGDDPRVAEEWEKMHAIAQDGIGLPKDNTEYIVGPWLEFDGRTETYTGEHARRANRFLREPRLPEFDIPSPDKV